MVQGWRIVKASRVATAFDGEGARMHGGRWNSPGGRVVYVSESRALATLEVLAGLGGTTALPAYSLIRVSFDERLLEDVTLEALPRGWDARPPGAPSQAVGDSWLRRVQSAVLRVPSVIVPAEHNYLLNPQHPDFGSIVIGEPNVLHVDPRLRHT